MAEKKEITCFLCHKTEHEGILIPCRKGGRTFGYVADVYPCSSMVVKTDNPPHFPLS